MKLKNIIKPLKIKTNVAWVVLLACFFVGFQMYHAYEKSRNTETTKPVFGTERNENMEKATYKSITPKEAEAMMGTDVIVLDVRTKEEYDEGHIKGAVLLTDAQIKEKAPTMLPDKNQTILVYCRSGARSRAAAKALIDMGYTQVYDFGGIMSWHGEVEQ